MKAIHTAIIFCLSLVVMCAAACHIDTTAGLITLIISFAVFAANAIYVERNQKRLLREVDELFPEK